jgi:hypothetical protein
MTSAVAGMRMALDQINGPARRKDANLIVLHVSDGNSQDFLDLVASTGKEVICRSK